MHYMWNYNNANQDDARSANSDVTINLDETPHTLNLNATLPPCEHQGMPTPMLSSLRSAIVPPPAPLIYSINLFVSPPTAAQFTLPATVQPAQATNPTEIPRVMSPEYHTNSHTPSVTMSRAHRPRPPPFEAPNLLVSLNVSTAESLEMRAPIESAQPRCRTKDNAVACQMTTSRRIGQQPRRWLSSAPMTIHKLQALPARQAMRGMSSPPQLQGLSQAAPPLPQVRPTTISPPPARRTATPEATPEAQHAGQRTTGLLLPPVRQSTAPEPQRAGQRTAGLPLPPVRQSTAPATQHAVRHPFTPSNASHAEHFGAPAAAASPEPRPRLLDHAPRSMMMGSQVMPPRAVRQQPWISSRPAVLRSGMSTVGENVPSRTPTFKLPSYASRPPPSFHPASLRISPRTTTQFLRPPTRPHFASRQPVATTQTPAAPGALSAAAVQCALRTGVVTTPTSGVLPTGFVMTPASLGRTPRALRSCLPPLKTTNEHISPSRGSTSPPKVETPIKTVKPFSEFSPCTECAIRNQNASKSPVDRYESPATQTKYLLPLPQTPSPVMSTPSFRLNKETTAARNTTSRPITQRTASQPFSSVRMASSQIRGFPAWQVLSGVPASSQLTEGRTPVSPLQPSFVSRLPMRHMSAPGELQRTWYTPASPSPTIGAVHGKYPITTPRPVIYTTASSQHAASQSNLRHTEQVRVPAAASSLPQPRMMERAPRSLMTGSLMRPPRPVVQQPQISSRPEVTP